MKYIKRITSKDDFINIFLREFKGDYDKIDKIIHRMETYISENEYDVQLELILHTFRTGKKLHTSDCFEEICEVAAPIFELLKTIDWGLVELHVLATMIIYTPRYTISEDFLVEALDILDDDFHDQNECEKIKSRLYMNLSMRLLRAKYYDGENPQEVKKLFDQCINIAVPIFEKKGDRAVKTVLLIRKALFYGDCEKISERLDDLKSFANKAWVEYAKMDIAEFLYHIGGNITTQLINFVIGYRIKKRRNELGLSTFEFADAIDTSQTVVNGFERGDKGVSPERLLKIAEILKVDVAHFYTEAGKKYVNEVTDTKINILVQLVSPLPEEDKSYVIESTRNYLQHRKQLLQRDDDGDDDDNDDE